MKELIFRNICELMDSELGTFSDLLFYDSSYMQACNEIHEKIFKGTEIFPSQKQIMEYQTFCYKILLEKAHPGKNFTVSCEDTDEEIFKVLYEGDL